MKYKPWPIVILAVFYFLSPFWTIFLSSWLLGMSPVVFCHQLILHGGIFEFTSLLIFPLAGLAIFLLEAWSYPIYLGLMSVALVNNMVLWHRFPKALSLLLALTIQFVNVLVVMYFLNPKIRTVFFNSSLKWWKSKPRYAVQLPCWISVDGMARHLAQTSNISEGGLHAVCRTPLGIGTLAQLDFGQEGRPGVGITSKVVFVHQDNLGHGFQFIHYRESRKFVHDLIRDLKRSGAPAADRASRVANLKHWAVRLFQTGDGMFPILPETLAAKSIIRRKPQTK